MIEIEQHTDSNKWRKKEPKSHPGGREHWEWSWMGFGAPETCYNDDPSVYERYKKFKDCFGAFYGIGDFDYWISAPLQRLSEKDKIELIKLLLEDHIKKSKPDASSSKRKYLGLNSDGTINKNFDEFCDERSDIFSILTLEECRNNKYAHNQRGRYIDGFYCSDCDHFFSSDSEEYIREEEFSGASCDLHNMGVVYHRAKVPVAQVVLDLEKEYEDMKPKLFTADISEVKALIKKIKDLRATYTI